MVAPVRGEVLPPEPKLSTMEHVHNAYTMWGAHTWGMLSAAMLGDKPVRLEWTGVYNIPHEPKISLKQFGIYVSGCWTVYEIQDVGGRKEKVSVSWCYVRKAQAVHADYRLRKYAVDYWVTSRPLSAKHVHLVPEKFDPTKSWGTPVGDRDPLSWFDSFAGRIMGFNTIRRTEKKFARAKKAIKRL